jgi:hypothetical protein
MAASKRTLDSKTKYAPTKLWEQIGRKPGQPWVPHTAQAEILSVIKTPWPTEPMSDGLAYPSIIGANCGRQLGKTELGMALLWQGATAPDDDIGPPQVRLTADTEEHANKVWDRFIFSLENTKLGQAAVKSHNKDRDLVTFHTGATIQKLSGNNPQALSGDSVTLWVVDEAQFFSQAAYANMLPSIVARNGVIVMLGVAQGNGPFKDICWRGELERRKEYPRYLRLRYSSYDNPYVKKEAIDLMAESLTKEEYRQLILAEWDQEGGRVFENVRDPILPGVTIQSKTLSDGNTIYYTELPKPGHTYYGGLDIALIRDYNVYSIWSAEGELRAWQRFNKDSSARTKARIVEFSAFWGHPRTVVDAWGIGIPMVEDLRGSMNVLPYEINTNQAKKKLVDKLKRRFENGWIRYPRVPEFINELDAFESKVGDGMNTTIIRYGAPSGKHDDWVMSAALAAHILPVRAVALPTRGQVAKYRQRGPWESI